MNAVSGQSDVSLVSQIKSPQKGNQKVWQDVPLRIGGHVHTLSAAVYLSVFVCEQKKQQRIHILAFFYITTNKKGILKDAITTSYMEAGERPGLNWLVPQRDPSHRYGV